MRIKVAGLLGSMCCNSDMCQINDYSLQVVALLQLCASSFPISFSMGIFVPKFLIVIMKGSHLKSHGSVSKVFTASVFYGCGSRKTFSKFVRGINRVLD